MANRNDNPFWRDVLSGRIRKRVWRRRLFRLISPERANVATCAWRPSMGLPLH